jgi:tRNA pseudouridine38-40 synthase
MFTRYQFAGLPLQQHRNQRLENFTRRFIFPLPTCGALSMGEKRPSDADLPTEPYPDSKRMKSDTEVEDMTSEPAAANDTTTESVGNQVTEPASEDPNQSKNNKDKKKRNLGRRRGAQESEKVREKQWGPKDGPKEPRLPKRECALMIGFCGSAYRGMQFQNVPPGLPRPKTVEGELFRALIEAGAVSKDNAEDPVKVRQGFQYLGTL